MIEGSQPARSRRLCLHPMSIAGLAARHVASPPGQAQFKVTVPPEDDFVIRCLDRGGGGAVEISVLRAAQGKLTVLTDRLVEIELIGTEADRAAAAKAVTKRAAISVSAIRKVIRKRRSPLGAPLSIPRTLIGALDAQ